MLVIQIENSFFDLPNDIQIPITATNPMCTETGFNELFTYSFTLPCSPKNVAIYNRYVNQDATIKLSFQSHLLATGVCKMKRDSQGISVMIKNDGLDLRQYFEQTDLTELTLPIIPICETDDLPADKITAWNNHMNSKLPESEPWNEGKYKFVPLFAAPAIEWAQNQDESKRVINPTMWDNGWPVNAYDLASGQYKYNMPVALPLKAKYQLLFPNASFINDGDYFTINSADNVNKYYVYLSVDSGTTDPAPSGRDGIKVDIFSTDSQAEVASKIAMKLALKVADFTLDDSGLGYIYVENVQGGTSDTPINVNIDFMMIIEVVAGTGTIEDANNNWNTTIAPFLRIQYIFKQLLLQNQIVGKTDILDSIPEFQALTHWNGRCLDLREDDAESQWNVHGTEINLNDFLPSAKMIDLFKLLRELFGCFFVVNRKTLTVYNINLNQKTVDLSKFCMPDFQIKENDSTAFHVTYGLSDQWKFGDFYIQPGAISKYLDYFMDAEVGSGSNVTDVTLPFTPLVDSNSILYAFKWPEMAKSKVYNQNDWSAFSKFVVGCFRGNFEVDYTNVLNTIESPETVSVIRLVCFNHKKAFPNELPSFGEVVNSTNEFGTCDIYVNEENSYMNSYSKPLYELKKYNQEIEKNFHLPFHKVMEIMKWKEPFHTIKQRNMSFRGVVKELKFTLSKKAISPTTITYLVNKKVLGGDFNNDFSNDFNT